MRKKRTIIVPDIYKTMLTTHRVSVCMRVFVVVVVNVSYYELRSVFVARLIFSCAKVRASKQTTTNEVKVFSMCMNKIKLCECIYSMYMFVCTIQPKPISKLYTHG